MVNGKRQVLYITKPERINLLHRIGNLFFSVSRKKVLKKISSKKRCFYTLFDRLSKPRKKFPRGCEEVVKKFSEVFRGL